MFGIQLVKSAQLNILLINGFYFFLKVVLSALLAVAAAKPSGIAHEIIAAPLISKSVEYHQPAVSHSVLEHQAPIHVSGVAEVGARVDHVATGVSHQSQTIVHSKPVISKVLAPYTKTIQPAPVLKTYTQPAVSHKISYAEPAPIAIHAAPIALAKSHIAYAEPAPIALHGSSIALHAEPAIAHAYSAPVLASHSLHAPIVSQTFHGAAAPIAYANAHHW